MYGGFDIGVKMLVLGGFMSVGFLEFSVEVDSLGYFSMFDGKGF